MRWRAPQRLEDVFPMAAAGQGIFHYLESFDVPWKDAVESAPLDLQYHLNRSGEKYVAPLVTKLVGDELPLSDSDFTKLAQVLFTVYGISWTKLYATLSLEYNPINNYDMTENEETTTEGESSTTSQELQTNNLSRKREADNSDTESGTVGVETDRSNTKTVDMTQTKTGQDKDTQGGTVGVETTDGGTVGVKGSTSNNNTDNRYGFNSSSAVPADSSSATGTSQQTTTNDLNGTKDTTFNIETGKDINETVKDSGTDSDTGTEKRDETRDLTFGHKVSETTTDTGTVSHEGEGTDKHSGSGTRKLTRSGNIGVTTSQQMIQSERDLWLWRFFDQVFSDLDAVLTLPIY